MRFAIGLVTDFEDAGFDTSNWRKSIDNTKTMCHDTYAKILMTEDKYTVHEAPSEEFSSLLDGLEWSAQEVV